MQYKYYHKRRNSQKTVWVFCVSTRSQYAEVVNRLAL